MNKLHIKDPYLAHVVQVVVLAARADALLAVARALHAAHRARRIHGAQEHRLELWIV